MSPSTPATRFDPTPASIGRFLAERGWRRDPVRSDEDVDVYVSSLTDDGGEPLALLAPATTELADYRHMVDLLVGALASLDGASPAVVRAALAGSTPRG